jgi:hypothetical protein
VLLRDPRVFTHGVNFERARFGRDAVDVHRPVAALRRNIFIQRIPRDTLHVVVVFGDLRNTFT